MKIGDRIKQRREELGYSVEYVANTLCKNKATIYRYESNEIENLPISVLEPLAKILKTTPGHLMGWNQKEKAKAIRIPVLGSISAGIPLEAITEIDSSEWEEIPAQMADIADYFALKITGQSMEPRISEGDVVIVRVQNDIESGEVGVVIVNECDATVKKVVKQENGIMLVAYNQSVYPPKFYDNKEIEELPVEIVGKVVELRAKF